MTKVIDNINAPMEWESSNDFDSHRGLLFLCVSHLKTGDVVLEYGSGFGSTPLLKKYCDKNIITFYSFDTDKDWAEKTGAILVSDFDKIEPSYSPTLLFIDGKPGEQRKDLIAKYADVANIIVAHDTEPGANYVYGMKDVLSTFKYRIDYRPEGKPHTTAVSNFINITDWHEVKHNT